MSVELRVGATAEEAYREAASLLAGASGHVALCGGSTPARAYELAAELRPNWSTVEVWWGDERCVPPDDERSNFRLARRTLLDRLEVSPRAIHRVQGELDPLESAARYDEELRGVTLDIAFLGIGADGHTASLFPHSPALEETARLAVAVEGPDVARVTLTPAALGAARHIVFLVVGDDKTHAVERTFGADPSPAIPASLIRGQRTTVLLDRAAAAGLSG